MAIFLTLKEIRKQQSDNTKTLQKARFHNDYGPPKAVNWRNNSHQKLVSVIRLRAQPSNYCKGYGKRYQILIGSFSWISSDSE